MPCHHPIRAWRTPNGEIVLGKEPSKAGVEDYATRSDLACGNCLGCQKRETRAWALRCHLEQQRHHKTAFTTLTYADQWLPPTLEKRHLQLWLKRLRKHLGATRPVRFFAAGEYGEQTNRPHYHAILYGVDADDSAAIEETWRLGHARTLPLTPGGIAYVVGYTNKKLDFKYRPEERVDPDTGEVYVWQPPFRQMSRRPGIGGHARQHHESWRAFAIHNGYKIPVPRFYHDAWEKQSTQEEIEKLKEEKRQLALRRDTTEYNRKALELMAQKERELKNHKRRAI